MNNIGIFGRIILGTVAILIASTCLAVIMTAVSYDQRAAKYDLNLVKTMPQASIIYDSQGQDIGRFFEENRVQMPPGPVPKLLAESVTACEDARFYRHHGIDPYGILRAAVADLFHSGIRQGASTITQQLARNSIGMQQRTYDRKILEIFLAHRIEKAYSKEEILHHYLDRIYYGQGIYGAETAANLFFGKTVNDLSIGEAALLGGMISGPNAFSPWKDYQAAISARNRALIRMRKVGYITAAEEHDAQAEPLALRPRTNFSSNYVQDEVHKALTDMIPEEQLYEGGLKITCTIDNFLQKSAEKLLNESLAAIEADPEFIAGIKEVSNPQKRSLQGAFYALDPNDGAIRALVGGRDYATSQFNRALSARRQVGSILKPLLYACAFAEKHDSPASWIESTPFDLTSPESASQISPGPRSFIRINEALAKSDNYCAVRKGMEIGPELFVYYAQQAGVHHSIPPYPSSYLGACDLTLAEMCGIYAMFDNHGIWNAPYLVSEIKDSTGQLLYSHEPQRRRVFTPEVAFQVTGMLQNVVDYGTAQSLRSQFLFMSPAAGKTGTSNDYRDAWFLGYTSSLVGGVWVGFDYPRQIVAEGYGSRLALPIWSRIFTAAQGHYAMQEFNPPADLQKVSLANDAGSGLTYQTVYLLPDQMEEINSQPGVQDQNKGFWSGLLGGN